MGFQPRFPGQRNHRLGAAVGDDVLNRLSGQATQQGQALHHKPLFPLGQGSFQGFACQGSNFVHMGNRFV